jgi:glutamine synthetase
MSAKFDSDNIFTDLEVNKVDFVNLQFSDIMGMVKSVTIPVSKLEDAIENGVWFDGSSIEGFTRISESDMLLRPDLSTYAIIPWLENGENNVARFICDVYTPDGKPYECDPRYILRKTMKEAEDMGYVFNTGPECEFFLFKKENGTIKTSTDHTIEPHDRGQYFDLVLDLGYEVRREMMHTLEKMGIEVESSHHEVAPGQHEIAFKYGTALETADKVITLKYTLKSIAQKHGLHATFMPKPMTGVNGNGMHVHQSLFTADNENAFFDDSNEYKLSETAYQFMAGQMLHAGPMCAVLNPTVNSYKRLVPGYEAPTYVCWANQNRSALIRVPRYSKGKEMSTRIEIRYPDPSTNPYLAFAVLLKSGLEGIKQKMQAPPPVEEDVYEFSDKQLEDRKITVLPRTLYEAMEGFKNDETMKEVLGEEFYEKYLRAKRKEWDDYSQQVTKWELSNYLENV